MTGKNRFFFADTDTAMTELVNGTDHSTLAIWAAACVEHVLPYFEVQYPHDHRPAGGIEALREWIQTGVFHMEVIHNVSLGAHAAAPEVERDNAARSAARAAGHAATTAHVATHALAAARYALQAIYRASEPSETEAEVARERDWQYQHLLELRNSRER